MPILTDTRVSQSDLSSHSHLPGGPQAQVQQASERWIAGFNRGDWAACASAYTSDAIMDVTPMGRYTNSDAIKEFWRSIVTAGASQLEYTDVKLSVIDDRTVVLAATWTMNVGGGIISEERWCMQADGRWLLEHDYFEVQRWTLPGSGDTE